MQIKLSMLAVGLGEVTQGVLNQRCIALHEFVNSLLPGLHILEAVFRRRLYLNLRTGTLPINIDFMQLDADDHFFSGDLKQLANWKYFGANVHAAACGVVVSTVDGQPNQVPGGFAPGATLETANGNAIVEDIGNGCFALYAHLQPGSLRVKKGDRIRQGQVIGLLGNSGNTDAPHLHFHIMDSPSPLDSNGLAFEFISFEVQGRVTSAEALEAGLKGSKAPVDHTAQPSSHHHQMPLVLDVMNFPSSAAR